MTFWFFIKINFENFETINTSHVLILYNPIKEHFRLEPYLENIVSKKYLHLQRYVFHLIV